MMEGNYDQTIAAKLFEKRRQAFILYNKYRHDLFRIVRRNSRNADQSKLSAVDLTEGYSIFIDNNDKQQAINGLLKYASRVDIEIQIVSIINPDDGVDELEIKRESCRRYLVSLKKLTLETIDFVNEISDNTDNIPAQIAAPIRLEAHADRLSIAASSSPDGGLQEDSLDSLRVAASDALGQAIRGLKGTHNADERFLNACHGLKRKLAADKNKFSPEGAGVQHQILSVVFSKLKNELPEIPAIQIEEALKITKTLLDEFGDWRAYKLAASRTHLSHQEALQVVDAAQELIDDLENISEVVDPEITSRLKDLISPATSGLISADSVAVPTALSVANIMAEISNIIFRNAHILEPLKDAAISATTKNANYFLMAGLLYIFRKYTKDFADIPGFKFMGQMNSYIHKNFPWLKDFSK